MQCYANSITSRQPVFVSARPLHSRVILKQLILYPGSAIIVVA